MQKVLRNVKRKTNVEIADALYNTSDRLPSTINIVGNQVIARTTLEQIVNCTKNARMKINEIKTANIIQT